MKPTANYNIVRNGNGWAVNHDGTLEGEYETKEAAFESAAIAALKCHQTRLRSGRDGRTPHRR
jgi:hypothetical protein